MPQETEQLAESKLCRTMYGSVFQSDGPTKVKLPYCIAKVQNTMGGANRITFMLQGEKICGQDNYYYYY